ncbi:hypothetical protein F4775DRAFT_605556 [Biscogniauxia sp. FL1348]|nr:hypothetical protein F4775DRAFT_605556 [Biscogniauxia sp. FL1348]
MAESSTGRRIQQKDVFCTRHGFPTCHICLHSINTNHYGDILTFSPGSESHHKVDPLFDGVMKPIYNLIGSRDGLGPAVEKADIKDRSAHELFDMNLDIKGTTVAGLPYYYCSKCELAYLAGGGPGRYQAHPSHINYDNRRYIIAGAFPEKYNRSLNKISCKAAYLFGGDNSSYNAVYEIKVGSDNGSVEWNLDNADISALTGFLAYVEKYIIPKRKALVREVVHTNSSYFAGQAWRFQLVVITSLNPKLLKLLLKAHKLKYSKKRGAFIERKLGIVTKKYPASEERRAQISWFVDSVKHLADLGIQIYWRSVIPSAETTEARKAFRNQPPTVKMQSRDQGLLEKERRGGGYGFEENISPTDTIGSEGLEDAVNHKLVSSLAPNPQKLPDRPKSRLPFDYLY